MRTVRGTNIARSTLDWMTAREQEPRLPTPVLLAWVPACAGMTTGRASGVCSDHRDMVLSHFSQASICVICGSNFLAYCQHNLSNSLTPAMQQSRAVRPRTQRRGRVSAIRRPTRAIGEPKKRAADCHRELHLRITPRTPAGMPKTEPEWGRGARETAAAIRQNLCAVGLV
jgi:hypothetical protein